MRRGIVSNIEDPRGYGRIKARLIGFNSSSDETPWAWPCFPFAGPGCGFYYLPTLGSEVWMELTDEGWVWIGCFYSGRNQKPYFGGIDSRVIVSPSGHAIEFHEDGEVILKHALGTHVSLKANGDIEILAINDVNIGANGKVDIQAHGDITINTSDDIALNNQSKDAAVITTQSICPFTGSPHTMGSKSVFVEGPV